MSALNGAGEAAAYTRLLMTLSIVAYAFVRFGAAAGLHVMAGAALVVLLEAAPLLTRLWIVRAVSIPLTFAVVFGVAFAPAPLGFGSTIPGPVMMETPLFLLMLCVLASYAVSVDPWLMAFAGVALLGCWTVACLSIQADPATLTRANLRITDYKTPLEVLRAVNQPHYLHMDFWRANLIGGGAVSLILCFAAFRVRRLARRRAEQEAARKALAAYFSPQIAELLSRFGDSLPPDLRELAVLDADLVNFSAQAETLAPESVAAVLGLYRRLATEAVFRHNGAVLNFVGDGVVAIFGLTPGARSAAAEAISAAEHLLGAWTAAVPPAGVDGLPALAIGVDFGGARAGVVGEGRSLSLLIQGAPMDGAARLQAATRGLGVRLLISEAAAQAAAQAADAAGLVPVGEGDERLWRPA